jgi:rubrerythrin
MPEGLPPIHQIDTDGAVGEAADRLARDPELAEAAERGDTRSQVLRKAALGGGALMGGGALLALPSLAMGADTRSTRQDRAILNYALTLEYLEADFYTKGVEGGVLKGRTLELVSPIRDHEQAHVAAVKQTVSDMGGKPVAKPEFTYPEGTFTDRDKFLKTASVFEELGVTAYHGQVPRVDDPEILKAAAAIAGVESRHAAILADLIGGNPFPSAFEKSMSMDDVLAAAGDFIK